VHHRVIRITTARRLAAFAWPVATGVFLELPWGLGPSFGSAIFVAILMGSFLVDRHERRRLPTTLELAGHPRLIDTKRFTIVVSDNRLGTGLAVASYRRGGRPQPDTGWEPSDTI
jgi:hypothetical protein